MVGGGGLVGAVTALVKLILNRNKPKADIARTGADTSETQADTAIKLSNQLVTLHDRMNLMEASIDHRQQENADSLREKADVIQRLFDQVQHFERLDIAYRQRSHATMSELGRLSMEIRRLEGCYAEMLGGKGGEALIPVKIRTYEQIVEPFPLPVMKTD